MTYEVFHIGVMVVEVICLGINFVGVCILKRPIACVALGIVF